jgi:hypothetical protein
MTLPLKGEQIVYAANDWRTDNRTSSHHIAQRLAVANTLLYLEAAGQRTPRASGRDLSRILSRLWKALKKPREVEQNVFVLSPLILPFHRYGSVRRLNHWLLNLWVRRACATLGFQTPIVWMTIPHYGSIMDTVNSKGIVYYCTDDFASFPNTDRRSIEVMERRILSKANVVFAVSESLVESKRRLNPNTYFSPHGVDTAHFRKASLEDTPVPSDISRIRRPIAGFFGLIETWFDLELLKHCATKLTDVSFVLIGRTTQNIADVETLPNVHFLGQKPYETIPNYLKAFDVGLIPFKLNDTVLHSNPLKFKEYLAGGKPIVSVKINVFEKYKELAHLADSYEDFASCIRVAIEEDSPSKTRARISAMEGESWDAKFEDIAQRVRIHIPC